MAPGKKIIDKYEFVNPSKAAKQAKLNKDRGNRMERDVAKYLNRNRVLQTRRTPMSGAGWIKGDNHVPLSYPPDFVLISCKTSEQYHELHGPYIPFKRLWFDELARDIAAMRSIGCKFGIIVVKYHGRRKEELFTFVSMSDAAIIQAQLDITLPSEYEPKVTGFKKDNSALGSWRMFRNQLLEKPVQVWQFPTGLWVQMPLQHIYEALLVSDAKAESEQV